MTQQERGRRLTDEEIDSWVADQQTPARHGTASVAVEIAYELHERLAGVGGRLAAAPAPDEAVRQWQRCPVCDGHGRYLPIHPLPTTNPYVECRVCHGSGVLATPPPVPAAPPLDVERLGLSDEQTAILRDHLASRQQTVSEFIGDLLMDVGLGRATGKEYPPPARLVGQEGGE